MFYFLLFLLLINGVFLGVIVLLQSGKGGGLASMGGGAGTDTLIGGRQAATLLTKATWVSGGLFLFLSLALSVISTRQQTPAPILRDVFQQGQAPPSILPGSQPAPGATQGTAPQAQPQAQPQTPPPTSTTNR
ncbi:MAG: preprotein translocase subunit SecG [Longimicrobiales bacterium]